ncbi:MAG: tRNA lysidine(34) synthetase TilS, partial [Dehalococcoidia bacterium]|nr:tRNA lysidine(34) synthetase TilS [Dehalococcoidia bacterium]
KDQMAEPAPSQQRKPPTLEQRVLSFIEQHHLVSGSEKLLVAVSGGPDSVCLLHILVKLQEELTAKLHVAHLNHQLRGAESEADADYVSDLAHQWGIPATIERRDVTGYQKQQRLSLEEAAREVRYSFLTQVAGSIRADRVAVGHTKDDHIETILLHLIRGAGTRGLRGLQPYTEWQSKTGSLIIIRPLLEISHQETEDYCRHHRLAPRLDASNLSLSPLRNRIRHQLLPLLQSYNPRVAEALLRTSRIASDDIDFVDKEIAQLWNRIAQQRGETIILDKKRFDQLPPTLKRYLLRASAEKLLGSAKDIEMRHIEEMMSALTKPAGKRLSLPGGLIFSLGYDQYQLASDLAALSPLPRLEGEVQLNIPGQTLIPGWRIEATIIDRKQMTEKGRDFTAYFDLGKTGDKLLVRPRQRGDRFQPLGLSQPKKVNEFMIDAKIPQAWRQQIPIVCSPSQILWVVGWRIDDRVKVTENTKQVLRLEFKRSNL